MQNNDFVSYVTGFLSGYLGTEENKKRFLQPLVAAYLCWLGHADTTNVFADFSYIDWQDLDHIFALDGVVSDLAAMSYSYEILQLMKVGDTDEEATRKEAAGLLLSMLTYYLVVAIQKVVAPELYSIEQANVVAFDRAIMRNRLALVEVVPDLISDLLHRADRSNPIFKRVNDFLDQLINSYRWN